MVLPLGFVRGLGPPVLLGAAEAGRGVVEPDGGVGAMLTVLAGALGVVAAAACSTPAGSCEDL